MLPFATLNCPNGIFPPNSPAHFSPPTCDDGQEATICCKVESSGW